MRPPTIVSRYQLVINGRPVRTIGSNLIPPDLLFGRMGARESESDPPRESRRHEHAPALGRRCDPCTTRSMTWPMNWASCLVQNCPCQYHWPEPTPCPWQPRRQRLRNVVKQVRNHPSIIEHSRRQRNALEFADTAPGPASSCGRLWPRKTAGCFGRRARTWARARPLGHLRERNLSRIQCPCFTTPSETMRAGEFGAASPANLEVWHRDMPP